MYYKMPLTFHNAPKKISSPLTMTHYMQKQDMGIISKASKIYGNVENICRVLL